MLLQVFYINNYRATWLHLVPKCVGKQNNFNNTMDIIKLRAQYIPSYINIVLDVLTNGVHTSSKPLLPYNLINLIS